MMPRSYSAPKSLASLGPNLHEGYNQRKSLYLRRVSKSHTAASTPTLLSPRSERLEEFFNVPDVPFNSRDEKQWNWLGNEDTKIDMADSEASKVASLYSAVFESSSNMQQLPLTPGAIAGIVRFK